MRNLTRCYGEHAVKVSDSYCSGQSKQAILSPKMNMIPSTQHTVTCTYKVQCSNQIQIVVTVTWCGVRDRGFAISIVDDPSSPSKLNAKQLRFGISKGNKFFGSSDSKIEIIWDLSSATYDAGPDPVSGFYVAVVLNSELILLLGDREDVELNKLISSISSKSKFRLLSRSEHLSGSSVYITKARFFDNGRSHDIVIKWIAGEKRQRELILSIYVDEKNAIEVKKLHWNFRGNETIYIDGCLVDMMWDVHDWLFNPKSGNAHFMFRPRTGLDYRLWLEEDKLEKNEQENAGVSLLICASKNPD
ncbi:DUF868 domain-containing protein [Heracleum sosnowskyi]|uniref:DUF868 domain-containing protein n=1 Tax=Heracleum sosnowskyi TaxID=360622 RepID=A0AAD8MZQ6_9APIA|nr:DUF868 domain-containing protein [Heracleum sosnowskyi]